MKEASRTLRQMTFADIPNATSSLASAFGPMPCDSLGGPTTDQCGPDPAHANLSARQAKELGLLTSGTYGPPSTGSSNSAILSQFLGSKLREKQERLGSTLYRQTWKEGVTSSGRPLLRLVVSVPRIKEKDCTGWPTTRANDATGSKIPPGRQGGAALKTSVHLTAWPTPRNVEAGHGTGNPDRAFDKKSRIEDQVFLAACPTPTCQSPSSLRGKGQDPDKRKAQGHTVNLTDAVNWARYSPARLTADGEMLTGSSAGMESGGQLNPEHPRWLMGLPIEWSSCADTAMQSSQVKRKRS